jgi:hypothetical protein
VTRPFKTVPRSKFGAQRTNGYASKREAEYARQLGLRKAATNGDVLDWLEQVGIKLPGGSRYVVDFLVFKRDGTWELVEIKGFETPEWKLKVGLLAEARPELFAKLEVLK